MTDYDRLWKEIISELFEEFLLFFAPDLYEQIDFSKPPISKEQELHKISPKATTNNRRTDKLIGVSLKSGEEKWILVHIEIQGNHIKDFPTRMFQYFYRAIDRYSVKLYTIALYTDDSPSFHPDTYKYSYFGTELTYRFNTFKILDQKEEELKQSNNPFALSILAGLYKLRSKNGNKIDYKATLIKFLLKSDHIPSHKIRPLLSFIDHLIELSDEETEQLLYDLSPLIEKEELAMALTLDDTSFAKYYKNIGKEEGKKEGIIETARNMLKDGMDVKKIRELTGLSEEEVESLI